MSNKKWFFVALLVIAVSALATFAWRSQQRKIRHEEFMMQAQIDRLHFLGLQSFTKTIEIQSALGVGGAQAKQKQLQKCFSGKGKDCESLASDWAPFNKALTENSSQLDADGKRCNSNCIAQRAARYRIKCSSEKFCEGVEFELTTSSLVPSSEKYSVARKTSTLVSGTSLALDPGAIAMMNKVNEMKGKQRIQALLSNLKIKQK